MTKRNHLMIVEIECDDPQGSRQAENRLHRWLELFGFTASSFGFKFVSIGDLDAQLIRELKPFEPMPQMKKVSAPEPET